MIFIKLSVMLYNISRLILMTSRYPFHIRTWLASTINIAPRYFWGDLTGTSYEWVAHYWIYLFRSPIFLFLVKVQNVFDLISKKRSPNWFSEFTVFVKVHSNKGRNEWNTFLSMIITNQNGQPNYYIRMIDSVIASDTIWNMTT